MKSDDEERSSLITVSPSVFSSSPCRYFIASSSPHRFFLRMAMARLDGDGTARAPAELCVRLLRSAARSAATASCYSSEVRSGWCARLVRSVLNREHAPTLGARPLSARAHSPVLCFPVPPDALMALHAALRTILCSAVGAPLLADSTSQCALGSRHAAGELFSALARRAVHTVALFSMH